MRRITKIVVPAAVAVLATAAVASANVAVTDGVGTVGKGDVQNALGYANDAALQSNYKSVTFGGTVKAERIWAEYFGGCWNSDQMTRRVFYIPGTEQVTVNAKPVLNNNGKVTGWTLTGQGTGAFTQDGAFNSSDIPMRDEIPEGCIPGADVPAGGPVNTWYPDMDGPIKVTGTSGLTVSGNGKTNIALPNTPTV